jgi:hypothetical protein
VTIGLGVSTIVLTSRLRSVEAERNALRVAADEAVRERAQQSEPAGPPNDAQKDRPVDVSPRQANGPPRRVMSFVLATGIARSDSDPGTTLKVPVSTDVQLRLELPPEAAATPVRATLQTVDGVELWVQDGIPAERVDDRRVAIVTVPAETVPAGDYLLMLQAGSTTPETVASYFFRIARP